MDTDTDTSSASSSSSTDTESDTEFMRTVAVCALLCCEGDDEPPPQKKRKRRWTHTWLQRRDQRGLDLLRSELEDRFGFGQMLRMKPEEFDFILGLVEPLILKADTNMRLAIPPCQRLSLTLRFLATGESFSSLRLQYRIGTSTVAGIVLETCTALYEAMKDDFLKTPTTEPEWRAIAQGFKSRWQFPHCLGALDGKHISIQPPANSGSVFYNYKGGFSIVLMALVDSDYKFIYANVGVQGRVPDAGLFAHTDLFRGMQRGLLNFPPPEPLPNTDTGINVPYALVGDEAFPLRCDLMKPYPHRQLDHDQRIFNYRLSRARRIVENAFGILANRWRVFRSTICLEPEKVIQITLASLCLHNFLCGRRSKAYSTRTYVDWEDREHRLVEGGWRGEGMGNLGSIGAARARNPTMSAKSQRDLLRDYFVSPAGSVPWQEDRINN